MNRPKIEDLHPGMYVAALNTMWRGIVPYQTPLVIKSVGKARIVAEPICPEGRDNELWSPSTRHLTVSDIIAVFPDEATGRARSAAAYRAYREAEERIRAMEKDASTAIHAALRGEC